MATQPRFALAATAAAMFTAGVSAHATFVEPVSWSRATTGVTYQEWDVFTGLSDQTPDVADNNPNGSASLTENSGGAFVTGGGNIYSFAVATDFTVTIPEADVPAPPHDVTAIVQIKTQGTELDYSSVKLNGLSPVDTAELFRASLGGFGGSDVETWFLFNVPYAQFGDFDGINTPVENLTLTFNAAGSSMSLDRLSIDTAIKPLGFYAEPNPIPEPASVALLGLGGLLVLGRARRQRR